MNKLITLTGDSGCGKTHLMRLLMETHKENISVIKKYSNRDMRPGEENAIEIQPGCSTEQVKAMDYVYVGHNNKLYWFSKEEIDEQLEQGKSPCIIIDNEEMLIRLCREYRGRICPVYIQRDTTDLDFIEELKKGNRTQEQIMQRLDSRHEKQELWKRRINLFGYRYIINGQFLDDENLVGWFETIAEENGIDIGEAKMKNSARGIVNYFRNLWKGRPAIMTSNTGEEPSIEQDEDDPLLK